MSSERDTGGRLWGVGVGPGDSGLMTLRAVEVLRRVDVIAIPRKDAHSRSVSWRIAEPSVGDVPGQERLYLHLPMTKDKAVLKAAWATAMEQLAVPIAQGKEVAFITEGDPFVYSTFIYLLDHARRRWPQLPIEVVPAVSSLSAVPAVIGVPLADGEERVAIIPASYGTDDLVDILRRFDTTVLMKVGSVMPQVVAALEETGLLDKAVYVSRATMDGQRIVTDLRTIGDQRCDYFSMVVVASRARSGVLVGRRLQGLSPVKVGA